jgi:hypothetical protein
VQGNRRQRYAAGAQMQTGVDEAVLAALSDADRAAVLAAMSGSEHADAPSSTSASGASNAEELPKFDCQGSTDQLQVLLFALQQTILVPVPQNQEPMLAEWVKQSYFFVK